MDYWKFLAKKAHIRYRFVKTANFAEVLKNIKKKRYDINMATSKTIDKEQYALFSKAYEKFPIAIATLKRKKFIINGVALEGKKVAVGKNYSTYFLLKSVYPKINFVFTKDTKEALTLVKNKKVFAAVDIEPVLHYQIIDNDFKDISITGITGVDFNLQIMVRNDYKVLLSIINKTINTITNKERIAIYKKWMGLKRKESVDYSLIWKITVIFLLIFATVLIAYLRQKKLQKEIINLNLTLEERIKEAVEKNKRDQIIMSQQSRLAQMGEVISMIAHQWKQPLNSLAILNSTLFLKYKNGRLALDTIEKFDKETKKLIKRMSNTIDNFRNFFKPDNKKIIFSLKESLDDSVELIKPILNHHCIKISVDVVEDSKVLGFPNELSQSFINIINNSKDAFLELGEDIDKYIKIKLYRDNTIAKISIEDNAGGIPEEIIDKIFDPYFSTKENKGGFGIGLYMTKMIIEKHMEGQIEISSDKEGTLTIISLKCVEC